MPKSKEQFTPVERVIPLQEPVRIYTAKELAAMPLKQMIDCRDAQEEYFVKSMLTLKPKAKWLKQQMEAGKQLIAITKKKRVHFYTDFFCDGMLISKRVINQLAHRKMIILDGVQS